MPRRQTLDRCGRRLFAAAASLSFIAEDIARSCGKVSPINNGQSARWACGDAAIDVAGRNLEAMLAV